MPKPPIDPDSFDKINFVIDSWTTGCDAPWYIYIETMKPAALEAFIVLISFGWADVLRGALRPKGLGRRTMKKKGRWNKRRPSFPEVGNTLGKNLPFAEQLDDFVKWGSKTKFLWRIDNAMQAGLFMWLVADVAEDFAFNWTSLLYESYWCQPDPPGNFSYSHPGWSAISDLSWTKPSFPVEDYENSPPAWTTDSGSSGPNGCMATSAFRLKKHPAFPPPETLQVRVINKTTGFVYGDSGEVEADAAGDASVPAFGSIPPFTAFQVRVRMTGTPWALYGDGMVLAVETLT